MIVKVDGVTISNFITNEISLNYDSLADTFSLTFPFFEYWEVSSNNKIRNHFKPLRYKQLTIYDDNRKLLLTGTILNHRFKDTSNGVELSISGYSKTGVLEDCPNVPKSENQVSEENDKRAISTNFSGLSLIEFAMKLCEPFSIPVRFDSDVSAKVYENFEQNTTEIGSSIASILSKLATLKNIVLKSTTDGAILFTQLNTSAKVVAKFSTGDGVVNDISLDVNGQSMHSEIHIVGTSSLIEDEAEDGEKVGSADFIQNPLITTSFRPTQKKQGVENSAISDAIKAAFADELKGITITVNCKGWKSIDDGTITPGKLVSIKAPGCYLYNYQTFMVRSVQLKENSEGKSSILTCVLPETMTGDQPKLIFD